MVFQPTLDETIPNSVAPKHLRLCSHRNCAHVCPVNYDDYTVAWEMVTWGTGFD